MDGQLVDDRVEVTGPAPLHDPGDGGVATGQAGGALLVAQGLGDDGVGELHLADALGVGLQQAGCDGRVEGVQDGLDRLVDDAGEHAEVDTPAEHGRGGQQLLSRRPELGDPSAHDVVDGGGDAGQRGRPALTGSRSGRRSPG